MKLDRVAAAATFLTALSSAASKPFNELAAAIKGGAAQPTGEAPELEPAETLNRIPLDDELEKALVPTLNQLGFGLEAEEILDQLSNSRTVSVARGPERHFYIVCIPKEILGKPGLKNENLGAVALLNYLFVRDSLVFIISRDLPSMYPSFETMMDDWSDSKGIKTIFIPWEYVDKFLVEKNAQVRIQRVQQMLKLDKFFGPPKPQPAAAATALTPDEQEEVVRIISQQASVPFLIDKPQDYFNDLVASADLPERAKFSGGWKGDPTGDARRLLGAAWILKYPHGHTWAGQHTLGWLLRAVLSREPLSPEDSRKVVKIILSHNLISNPEALQALRARDSATQTGAFSV